MNINWKGIDKLVIVRAIATIIAAVNVILGYLGVHVISISNGELSSIVQGLIVLATVIVWAWGWWKNNSITNAAQFADAVKKQAEEVLEDGVKDYIVNVTAADSSTEGDVG